MQRFMRLSFRERCDHQSHQSSLYFGTQDDAGLSTRSPRRGSCFEVGLQHGEYKCLHFLRRERTVRSSQVSLPASNNSRVEEQVHLVILHSTVQPPSHVSSQFASTMSSLLKSALFLGVSTLALASVIPCGSQVALDAVTVAGGVVVPSGFWQIYEQDTQRSTNLFPSAPNGTATFAVSQGANAANQLDLIATFTNIPSGQGPYQIEFLYSNPARAGYGSDGNDVIDTFAVTGALPVRHISMPLPAPSVECKRKRRVRADKISITNE